MKHGSGIREDRTVSSGEAVGLSTLHEVILLFRNPRAVPKAASLLVPPGD